MLEKEPSKRITADEALHHAYFSGRSLKKAPSTDDLYAESKEGDELPKVREK